MTNVRQHIRFLNGKKVNVRKHTRSHICSNYCSSNVINSNQNNQESCPLKSSQSISDQRLKKKVEAYERRKEEKIERLRERAEKAEKESNSLFEATKKKASILPFGQPILVGHHSENRHRNFIKSIDSGYRKAFELDSKAEMLNERAKNMEESDVISSDNPLANKLLEDKLKTLEKRRQAIKEENKRLKKEGKPINPSYILSNLGQNIRSVKQRIKEVEKKQQEETKEYSFSGGTIREDTDLNRLMILYDEKPDFNERTKLKRYGFRWSPRNKAWQRQLTNNARYSLKLMELK